MRRLAFITLLVSGAAVAWPPPVSGQQAPMPVVGVLSSQSQDSEAAVLAAWHQALNETGYVGGRNVALEYRFADGHAERLPMLATDLVRRQVTVLMANTTPPAFAAKAATATIPIVFVTGVDPVEVGLVASFNRPGANVTGVTFLSNKLVAKRLELLAALVSGAAPIGMFGSPSSTLHTTVSIGRRSDSCSCASRLGLVQRSIHTPASRRRSIQPPRSDSDGAVGSGTMSVEVPCVIEGVAPDGSAGAAMTCDSICISVPSLGAAAACGAPIVVSSTPCTTRPLVSVTCNVPRISAATGASGQ